VPVVAAELDDGTFTVLLGAEHLAACSGSPTALIDRVGRAMRERNLSF
jgi:hypothetical protein